MKKYLFAFMITSVSVAVTLYFVSDLRAAAYGLFALGFGTMIYYGYAYSDKRQRRLVMGGSMLLTLSALYKFFNSLS